MEKTRSRTTIYWRRAAKQGASGKNLIWLRNRIISALNEKWPHLGCFVTSGDHFFGMGQKKKNVGLHLLIFGVAIDGRAIVLYPIRAHNKSSGKVPPRIKGLMMEYELRGALVGTCVEIGDAYDVVIDNPAEYPRKKRTYTYRKAFKTNDSEE